MKHWICGMLLAACAAGASAVEQTFEWSYQNFRNADTGEIVDTRLSGRFVVDDENFDGLYEWTDVDPEFGSRELKSFVFEGIDYMRECPRHVEKGCSISQLVFRPGEQLDFVIATWDYTGPVDIVQGVDAPTSWGGYTLSNHGGLDLWQYEWYEGTVFTITPVPEPQTWLMLAGGLLAVAGGVRRTRRAA